MLYRLGNYKTRTSYYFFAVFLLIYFCFIQQNVPFSEITTKLTGYGQFLLIGLVAAIVANSTGAGGGIVFLPAFTLLGLSPVEALATSFAIQCFGMTSGALAWLQRGSSGVKEKPFQWGIFQTTLFLTVIPGLIGLLTVQWLEIPAPIAVKQLFALLSFVLAFAIIYRIKTKQFEDGERTHRLTRTEKNILVIAALLSGALTAWLSIGIGEIIAVTLIIMGFSAFIAVAAAVCISSISVLLGVQFHVWTSNAINLDVLLFAAPGALIGGAIASRIATLVGITRLKVFMSGWIMISAIVYLNV